MKRDCSRGTSGQPTGRRLETAGSQWQEGRLDLFGINPSDRAADFLSGREWPAARRFPTNRRRDHVRDVVWEDLVSSRDPLLVAGYSAIGMIVELIAAWGTGPDVGHLRLVIGAEPFESTRHSFRSDRKEFTDESRRYWLETRGVSLRLSAKVLQALEAVESGKVLARFVHGTTRMHAKMYIGAQAATLGSSNFTEFGLVRQFEANARFELRTERQRYRDVVAIAENYWAAGEDWSDELARLLEALLRVVTWQEALARACAELLTGAWAERYINGPMTQDRGLWPSQRAGIAEALWILENVGSVLVADATGSGKTRMGAHLVRAARDRLWRTGRVRHDLTVLVGPPAVIDTWENEALGIGVSMTPVSHGRLSRSAGTDGGRAQLAVKGAQILAVDEAHNFLNAQANRTQRVRHSLADNVMLFTATPISRGASDLLNLIGLLGPDNFDDATLGILGRLDRQGSSGVLTPDELVTIRREIQRFTVRRTKSQINELVDLDAAAYVDKETGRVCRYPKHLARTYPTGETSGDNAVAERIRSIAESLVGLAQLERRIAVPDGLRQIYTDEEWLRFRLRSATALARHHVFEALRSSRAALVEHLSGTAVAASRFDLDPRFKSADTGDVIGKLERLADEGPPLLDLECAVDPLLTDPSMWATACTTERGRYAAIAAEVHTLSDAREQTKVSLLAGLFAEHDAVLVFDRHPITLAVLEVMLRATGLEDADVIVATGGSRSQKTQLIRRFALDGSGRAIALCSDAMNEGLNLQRASCIVHLDLPTTLRVAEQRVGRVDRMNSPHDNIESWWPEDGPAFATRAYEKLVRRARESEELLGANLRLPEFERGLDDRSVVTTASQVSELEGPGTDSWDGIQDALEPVRRIVLGGDALVPPDVYAAYQDNSARVMARVAPVASTRPWAFFAIAAIAQGAPRWMLIDGHEPLTDLGAVAERLRELLGDYPPNRELDEVAVAELNRFLDVATSQERLLLPRRMRRALDQMSSVLRQWAIRARRAGDERRADEWLALEALASPDGPPVDPFLVAERWISVVTPVLERHRELLRRARYVLLRDIEPSLISDPLAYEEVLEVFVGLPTATPLEERVSACILGVPAR